MIPFPQSNADEVRHAAAEWVLRQDRGLTAEEQDALSQWLAADPRHGEAFAEQRWGWDELDRLAGIQTTVHALPDPDLLAPAPRRFPFALWACATGLAAVLALGAFFALNGLEGADAEALAAGQLALIEQRTLEDGSVVSLNRGADISVHFTAAERRLELLRGEANFQVAKNPARPFVVSAQGVDVRAVGTAFNVRLGRSAVEVLVTEGHVEVAPPAREIRGETVRAVLPVLGVGQRTVVPLERGAEPPRVTQLSDRELETRLAWQPRMLDFTEAPLNDIVAEFNRRNNVRLRLADHALEDLRLSAAIRSDNVEGFVRLMESDFGMRAEWRAGEIVLRRR